MSRSAYWRWLAVVMVVGGLVALLAWQINGARTRARLEIANKKAERIAKNFADDRGKESATILADPKVIQMLADDQESADKLTTLFLDMIDFEGHQLASARKLQHVRKLHFYSCNDADNLLSAFQGSPAIEDLYFEVTHVSDEGVGVISTFPNLKHVRFEQVVNQAREDLLRKSLPGVTVEIPFPESEEPSR